METQTRVETQIRRRFTVEEYHRMAEAGILHEDDRVELIGGDSRDEPYRRQARQVRHRVDTSADIPGRRRRARKPSESNPVGRARRVTAGRSSAQGKRKYQTAALPAPEDVLLLIEVADTSLAYERGVKLPLYARAELAEVWLVDLNGGIIERHTEPSEAGYRLVRRAGRGEILESAALPVLALPVDAALG